MRKEKQEKLKGNAGKHLYRELNDLHGCQVNAYKIIENLNIIEKDNLQLFGLLCQVKEFQLI